MNKRKFLSISAATVVLAACTTTGPGSGSDPVATRRSIDAAVDIALARLRTQVPSSIELTAKAKGVLVFPSVVSAGFVVGGSYGEGALRTGYRTVGYYSTAAASAGLLAGADSKAVFVIFMTQDALDQFLASKGWTAGVDASVSLINVGADVGVDTQTMRQPVVGYVLTNAGLMANLSIDGTKITRLDP
jgi:lipid-binding SYLF domain-containing protein